MEKKSYYSNGKLLITGEYLVLKGALALAVPTIPGQELTIDEGSRTAVLNWESFFEDTCWFNASFSLPNFDILETSDLENAGYMSRILQEAHKIKGRLPFNCESCHIRTRLDFHPEWGLGSSSSLINNIASLFGISAYELFFNTQKGSAYDIACASARQSLIYSLEESIPHATKVLFNPSFKDKLAFVYSGQKQDSNRSLSRFFDLGGFHEFEKGCISKITSEIVNTTNIKDFNELLDEHEEIMAKVLKLQKIKDSQFSDFPGSVKSLGAWGGDFILASSETGFKNIQEYFKNKGLKVVFPWEDLVLSEAL